MDIYMVMDTDTNTVLGVFSTREAAFDRLDAERAVLGLELIQERIQVETMEMNRWY